MKTRLFNYLITLIFVGLAGWAAVALYHRYVESPWTRDGQVRANIVGIAPRVSGPIIHVGVVRTGGTGDLRSFQNSFLAALGLAACAALLILTTPFLTDYLAMNLALFLVLFLFGFTTARSAGVTFWMQIGMLTIFIVL